MRAERKKTRSKREKDTWETVKARKKKESSEKEKRASNIMENKTKGKKWKPGIRILGGP